jgi:hypothetical protein
MVWLPRGLKISRVVALAEKTFGQDEAGGGPATAGGLGRASSEHCTPKSLRRCVSISMASLASSGPARRNATGEPWGLEDAPGSADG